MLYKINKKDKNIHSEIKEAEAYIVIMPKPQKGSDEDFLNYISE